MENDEEPNEGAGDGMGKGAGEGGTVVESEGSNELDSMYTIFHDRCPVSS